MVNAVVVCGFLLILMPFAGDRYHQDQFGLRVKNITRDDNGLYSCCAEVESTGAYTDRVIDVIVDCELLYCHVTQLLSLTALSSQR